MGIINFRDTRLEYPHAFSYISFGALLKCVNDEGMRDLGEGNIYQVKDTIEAKEYDCVISLLEVINLDGICKIDGEYKIPTNIYKNYIHANISRFKVIIRRDIREFRGKIISEGSILTLVKRSEAMIRENVEQYELFMVKKNILIKNENTDIIEIIRLKDGKIANLYASRFKYTGIKINSNNKFLYSSLNRFKEVKKKLNKIREIYA